jgi:hypothetical protein
VLLYCTVLFCIVSFYLALQNTATGYKPILVTTTTTTTTNTNTTTTSNNNNIFGTMKSALELLRHLILC